MRQLTQDSSHLGRFEYGSRTEEHITVIPFRIGTAVSGILPYTGEVSTGLTLFVLVAVAILLLTVKYWWPYNRVAFIVGRHVGAKAATLSSLSRPFPRVDLPNIER